MKKYYLLAFVLAALLFTAGRADAYNFIAQPEVTWNPQSLCYPAGTDAVYSVTVSGQELSFSWRVIFGGKEYEVETQKAELMAAGLSSYCADIRVESGRNISNLTICGIKEGIDSVLGNFTKVYCLADNSRGGTFSSNAYVLVGPADAPYPANIYVARVSSFAAGSTSVPKVPCTVFEDPETTYEYQWYTIEQEKLEYIQAVIGADEKILIPEFEKTYTDYVCKITATRNGVTTDSYSSPVNVYQYSGDIDPSYDQLVITKQPDRIRFNLGDKVDLSGLKADYYKDGKVTKDLSWDKLTTDITVFSYAGPVEVTLRYGDEEGYVKLWVEPDEKGNWEIDDVPAETAAVPTETSAQAPVTQPAATTEPETETQAVAPSETAAAETPEATKAEESTQAPTQESVSTQAPTEPASTVPQTTQDSTEGGSGSGNTVLIVIVIILAVVCGLLGGILIGKKK